MAFFDMPLEQLETYKPIKNEPDDFDDFWQQTLNEARQHPLNGEFVPYDAGLSLIDVYDVTYSGYGGQRIKGWYMRPKGVKNPLPCIIEYIGYGGGRGFPHEWLVWPTAGYALFVMDTRGQGSSWRHGDTPDIPDGANPSIPGFMTQGIVDPKFYYYRRVFTDAVRAVDLMKSHPDVDETHLALTGGSQGGGITIAASALSKGISLCIPDVPFLCHFRRAVGLTDNLPYQEIVKYLVSHRTKEDIVFGTLDYFDGVNFASRITAKSLFSTSLMDATCPPSTVFAAYNHLTHSKDIKVYRYNQHEGGGSHHTRAKLDFVKENWG